MKDTDTRVCQSGSLPEIDTVMPGTISFKDGDLRRSNAQSRALFHKRYRATTIQSEIISEPDSHIKVEKCCFRVRPSSSLTF